MIQGKKIMLRPVEERDLDLIAQWRNHPDNRQFFFSPFFVNRGGQKKWYEKLLADGNRVVLMMETYDGKTVGMAALDRIDWRNQTCEGGQFVVDPAQRSYGYAEESITLMADYAFNELNLNRMYVLCYSYNRVVKLLEMFGFRQEGVMRQAVYSGGQFHDKVLMSLLRDEWRDGSFED